MQEDRGKTGCGRGHVGSTPWSLEQCLSLIQLHSVLSDFLDVSIFQHDDKLICFYFKIIYALFKVLIFLFFYTITHKLGHTIFSVYLNSNNFT